MPPLSWVNGYFDNHLKSINELWSGPLLKKKWFLVSAGQIQVLLLVLRILTKFSTFYKFQHRSLRGLHWPPVADQKLPLIMEIIPFTSKCRAGTVLFAGSQSSFPSRVEASWNLCLLKAPGILAVHLLYWCVDFTILIPLGQGLLFCNGRPPWLHAGPPSGLRALDQQGEQLAAECSAIWALETTGWLWRILPSLVSPAK